MANPTAQLQQQSAPKKDWLTRVGPFAGLFAVVAIFAIISGSPAQFLSAANLRIVFAQTVIVAISAIGMTVIIISAGIDLSVGAIIALTSVITALLLQRGYSPAIAVIAAIALGAVVGLVNGLAVTQLRVVPFIATLGTLGIARGAAKFIANQQTVSPPATWLNELAVSFPRQSWMLVSPGVWIAIILAAMMSVVLDRTVFGRRVYAIGSNEVAARACGIRVNRMKLYVYSLGGIFFGLAGVMQMSRLRQGDPTVAMGVEL